MTQDLDPRDDNDPSDYDYLGRVDLDKDGHFSADVFENTEVPPDEELRLDLNDILDLMGLDINEQDTLLDLVTQSAQNIESEFGFDFHDESSRGGYTREEVIEFLNETGWWGIADIFYDAELDEYYVNINYEG